MTRITAITLICMAAGLFSCTTQRELRESRVLERQDRTEDATRAALRAVRENPDSRRAKAQATRLLSALVDEKLAEAEQLAKEHRYADALKVLQEHQRTVDRALKAGVTLDDPARVSAAAQDITAQAVAWHKERAEEAMTTGSWATAVAKLEASEALSPQAPEVQELLATARRRWAAEELEVGEYRSAAARLARNTALKAPGIEEDRQESFELYLALGRSELGRGACRAAVLDFEAAGALRGASTEVASALAQALACARTDVSIRVGSGSPAGFRNLVVQGLAARGSRHLHVDSGPAGPRLLAAGPDGPPVRRGPYSMVIDVSPGVFRPQVPSRSTQTVRTQTTGPCVDPYGFLWPGTCDSELLVTYEEIAERIVGDLSAAFSLRDNGMGVEISGFSLRVLGEEQARWRGDVLSVMSTSYGGGPAMVVWNTRPSQSPIQRARVQREAARERLAQSLQDSLADKLVGKILEVIDSEPTVPDRVEAPHPPFSDAK